MMKIRTLLLAAVASLSFALPSFAQYQVPAFSVPIGRGAGMQGFDNVPSAVSGYVFTANGVGVKPSYQPLPPFGTVTSITLQGGVKSTNNPLTANGVISLDPNYMGFATQNCTLAASVGSNTLTVALKDNAGADPSAASPCNINYRSATASAGGTTSVQQTSALSINTIGAGATLGSSNSVPFRLWVVVFNNAGTNVLGLINCSTSGGIFPLNEGGIATSVQFSAGATSAGVFYTPNGTTVSAKAYRILGYVEYASGLATAGTYVSLPTTLQIFGPGIKKPGDVVQASFTSLTSAANGTNTYTLSNTAPTTANGNLVGSAAAFTPTATMNFIRISASAVFSPSGAAGTAFLTQTGSSSSISTGQNSVTTGGTDLVTVPLTYQAIAGSVSATTVSLYVTSTSGTTRANSNSGNTGGLYGGTASSFIRIEEIMG